MKKGINIKRSRLTCKLFKLISMVSILLLASCATSKNMPLSQKNIDLVDTVRLVTAVPQCELNVEVVGNPAAYAVGGVIGGAVGGIVVASIEESERAKNERVIMPIKNALSEADFNKELNNVLERELSSIDWCNIQSSEMVRGFTKRQINQYIAEMDENALLVVRVRYYLTCDLRQLNVLSSCELYIKEAGWQPVFHSKASYVSDVLGYMPQDEAVKEWAKDNGLKIKATLDEGIKETAAMLIFELQTKHFGKDKISLTGNGYSGKGHIIRREDGLLVSEIKSYTFAKRVYRREKDSTKQDKNKSVTADIKNDIHDIAQPIEKLSDSLNTNDTGNKKPVEYIPIKECDESAQWKLYYETIGKNEGWVLKKDKKNGVKIYTRETNLSPIKAFRGIVDIKADFKTLVSFISDIHAYPSYVYLCNTLEIVEYKNESNLYIRTRNEPPKPVQMRDTVSHIKWHQDPKTGAAIMDSIAVPKLIPEQKGFIRTPLLFIRVIIKPKENYMNEVTFEGLVEPGGDVSPAISSYCVTATPEETLSKLKDERLFDNERYQNRKVAFLK